MPLPIAIEFLSPDDPNRFFLLEKHTGKVQLVENGVITRTLLDLPVNTAYWERGLLYITKHPDFQRQRLCLPVLFQRWHRHRHEC
jgi:hypothetical protein